MKVDFENRARLGAPLTSVSILSWRDRWPKNPLMIPRVSTGINRQTSGKDIARFPGALVKMSSRDDSIARVYAALGNPIRRRIVDILKTKGRAGFKELHDTLKISVGALYHHLEALEGLVAQDPDKKYLLTDQGSSVIQALSTSEEKISTREIRGEVQENRLGFLSKEILFGRSLLNYLNEEPIRTLPLSMFIVLFGGWVSAETNLEPLLLFYLNPSSGINRAFFLLLFPLGWLATFAVTDILSVLIFKRKGGDLSLLNGTAFAMLPLLIVPGIFLLERLFSATLLSSSFLLIILGVSLQVWVVCLLSSSLSIAKGLRIERTAVVSLGVIYLNIIALVAALQLHIF